MPAQRGCWMLLVAVITLCILHADRIGVAADRCNFPQYHPTRVNITRDGPNGVSGIFVQRPYRNGNSYAYPDEWEHLVVKGMGYSPVPTGWELSRKPNGDFYGVDYDYIWKRDLHRMKDMGINVLRVWNWNFMGSARHTAFLDALWELDMFILVPFMMGTLNSQGEINYKDLHAVTTRQKVIEDWTVFIASHSNHPAVLGYLVGNEVEKTVYKDQMPDFFSLLNLMIDVAHETERQAMDLSQDDKWFYHPVSSPFAADTFKMFYMKYYDWLNIDFWSLQLYSDNKALEKITYEFEVHMNETNLFGDQRRYAPLMLTERGFSIMTNKNAKGRHPILDSEYQAESLAETWAVVQNFSLHTCLGVCIMEWNDEWWKGTASDVQNKGCPNPYANVHANCSTVITSSNSSFENMTLVFEEYLGITEQQGPEDQPLVNTWVSSKFLRFIFHFLAPVNRYCIKPRRAFYTMRDLWQESLSTATPVPGSPQTPEPTVSNATIEHEEWWCGQLTPGEAFFRNPIVLVWLPSIAVLTVSLIIACTKCGVRKETKREKMKRENRVNLTETNFAYTRTHSNLSSASMDSLGGDSEGLLSSQSAFSAKHHRRTRVSALYSKTALKKKKGAEDAPPPVPKPFDPEMKHVMQLIFDKLDVQSLGATEQDAKDFVRKTVRSAFERELEVSPALAERFGVVTADGDVTAVDHEYTGTESNISSCRSMQDMTGESASSLEEHEGETPAATDGSPTSVASPSATSNAVLRPMCMDEAPGGVEEAVKVVHFRMFEGYGLWSQKVRRRPWDRPSGDGSVGIMIQQLTLFTLLRDVCGTMNHSPELMMLLFDELLSKDKYPRQKASVWRGILDGDTGLMKRCYDALSDKKLFMSLDDFNVLGLDNDTHVEKLCEGNIFYKTFPERGGLHTLFANYSWLIRLFLWMWITGWYMQPVHMGRTLCLNTAFTTLTILDSATYALSSLCVLCMVWGSPTSRMTIMKSIILGLLHAAVSIIWLSGEEFATKEMNLMYGLKLNLSFIYILGWFVVSLVREIYLFSNIAFGEHKMRGTYASVHGKPRMVFGVALAIGVIAAVAITMVITGGGNEQTANVALGLFKSGFWKPFVFLIVAILLAALASRFAGKFFNDTRSVVEFAPVGFWIVFAVLVVLINIFWLVPSVTNLRFSICECQTQKLNLTTETCDWRNKFACQIAVILTWTATFFVSFVVGYCTFIGCSLACGIAVAKINQIGSVREWSDVTNFGNDIILNNFKYLTWAAEDHDVARAIWNAFIDSMYKGYLLELKERDSYMFQTHTVECFQVLGKYFVEHLNDEEERRVVCECIQILAQRKHEAIQLMKALLLPEGLYSGLKRQRRILAHRLKMALSGSETLFDQGPSLEAATFAKTMKEWKLLDHFKPLRAGHIQPKPSEVARAEMEGKTLPQNNSKSTSEEAECERRTHDLDAIMSFFASYSSVDENAVENMEAAWDDDEHFPPDPKKPNSMMQALRTLINRAHYADFQMPPRNEEAARRCIHQLWSVECVKNEEGG